MLLKIFSIFDQKTLTYSPPFFMQHDGQAKREFGDLANDTTSKINKHPADYSLHCLGNFDDNTAELVPLSPPLSLGCAVEYVIDQPLTTHPVAING